MPSSKQIDRRTILKGAAWATPVILFTTAAPAAATSIVTTTGNPSVDRDGNTYTVSVPATSSKSVTIIATMTVSPDSAGTWADGVTGAHTISNVVGAGATVPFTFPAFTRQNNNGEVVTYTVTFSVDGHLDSSLTRSGQLFH